MLIDLGSTKREITTAMQALPERFDPIGGHPMCGKETSGLENADPHLYQGAPFALVALARTTDNARACALELVGLLGAHPLWLDPTTHDAWVAATSHLPYLAANALAFTTPTGAAPMAGPGFKSTTRLALSPSSIMLDVLKTNRENILAALRRYRTHLERLEDLLSQAEFTPLAELLDQGAEQRRVIDALQKGMLT